MRKQRVELTLHHGVNHKKAKGFHCCCTLVQVSVAAAAAASGTRTSAHDTRNHTPSRHRCLCHIRWCHSRCTCCNRCQCSFSPRWEFIQRSHLSSGSPTQPTCRLPLCTARHQWPWRSMCSRCRTPTQCPSSPNLHLGPSSIRNACENFLNPSALCSGSVAGNHVL